jgi:hypothetical protein
MGDRPRPMGQSSPQSTARDLASVRDGWPRWTALVADAGRGHLRAAEAEYAALHGRLVASCRALAGGDGPERDRAYFQGLEELTSPWMSARMLASGEKTMLAELLRQCRQVERELGVRSRTRRGRARRWVAWLLLAPTLALGSVLALWAAERVGVPVPALGRLWVYNLGGLIDSSNALQQLLILAIVLTLISIQAVLHTARS